MFRNPLNSNTAALWDYRCRRSRCLVGPKHHLLWDYSTTTAAAITAATAITAAAAPTRLLACLPALPFLSIIYAFIACMSAPALLLKLDFAGINMNARMFLHLWSQACIEFLAIDRLISL